MPLIAKRPLYKCEIARELGISKSILKRWVKNAHKELGFEFGNEKLVITKKCNAIFALFS
jgi:transposase-like protein